MSEKSKAFLEKYRPNILKMSEVNDALKDLYKFINDNGFAPPNYYDYNELGDEAQRVYDDLYDSN